MEANAQAKRPAWAPVRRLFLKPPRLAAAIVKAPAGAAILNCFGLPMTVVIQASLAMVVNRPSIIEAVISGIPVHRKDTPVDGGNLQIYPPIAMVLCADKIAPMDIT